VLAGLARAERAAAHGVRGRAEGTAVASRAGAILRGGARRSHVLTRAAIGPRRARAGVDAAAEVTRGATRAHAIRASRAGRRDVLARAAHGPRAACARVVCGAERAVRALDAAAIDGGRAFARNGAAGDAGRLADARSGRIRVVVPSARRAGDFLCRAARAPAARSAGLAGRRHRARARRRLGGARCALRCRQTLRDVLGRAQRAVGTARARAIGARRRRVRGVSSRLTVGPIHTRGLIVARGK